MSEIFMWIVVAASAVAAIIFVILTIKTRRDYIRFTENVCRNLDALIAGGDIENYSTINENLYSKMQLKLIQLTDVIKHHERINTQQREEIQSMVSDISHQLNTPLANLTMYNDTILNHDLSKEKQRQCTEVMQSQIEKLDFLVKALVKMSRLESNVIAINREKMDFSPYILGIVSDLEAKAEKKNITIEYEQPQPVIISCDPKWTAEAIFNITENAVKYTPENGKISISVERLEMYTKITVSDTGIGISQNHINDIFKRFFREGRVKGEDGLGIGLYLSRNIISRQDGYIKVSSKEGGGSEFSVYLSNDNLG